MKSTQRPEVAGWLPQRFQRELGLPSPGFQTSAPPPMVRSQIAAVFRPPHPPSPGLQENHLPGPVQIPNPQKCEV